MSADDGMMVYADAGMSRATEERGHELALLAACLGFTLQHSTLFVANIAWRDLYNAKPLEDIRWVAIKSEGALNRDGVLYMNGHTYDGLRSNHNPSDLYGHRAAGFAVATLDTINKVLVTDNLPSIVLFDRRYVVNTLPRTLQRFLPDGVVLAISANWEWIGTLHTWGRDQ